MTRFLVCRRGGARAQLHVAVRQGGQVRTACARNLPVDGSTQFRPRADWDADRAVRCLACSRKVGAAPGAASGRRIR